MKLDSIDRTLVQLIRTLPPLNGQVDRSEISPIAWDLVVQRAERTGLASLLYIALKPQIEQVQLSKDILERLRRDYINTSTANLIIFRETARLLECFQREQIPVILLKGVALANALYDDMGLRTLGDVDILIHPGYLVKAQTLMPTLGYVSSLPDIPGGFNAEYGWEQCFVRSIKPRLAVDIHWYLFNPPFFRQRISVDWFWQHTQSVRADRQDGLMFDPAAQLIHLAGHYALNHRTEGLRWLYDIALLIARHGTEIPWTETLDTASKFGLNRVMQFALRQVVQVWGMSLAVEVHRAMQRYPLTMSERFTFAMFTSPRVEASIVWHAWSTPGLRGKFTYLWRQLIPSKLYMMERYQVADARILPLVYSRRLLHGAKLFVHSLGSMAMNVWRMVAGMTR